MTPTKKAAAKGKTTSRARKPSAIKLQGYVIWIFIGGDAQGASQRFEVQHAILRESGTELVIDCDCALPGDAADVYTITLRRESPLLFRGVWSAGKSADRSTGTCSCRVYSNGPRLALLGTWHERDGIQQWLAELSPTESK
jgi:hypothetical protein